jgi:hypothetical protein
MKNPFEARVVPVHGPAADLVPAVPSDTEDLPFIGIAFLAATSGTVVFDTPMGDAPRTIPVTASQLIPCGVTRVYATGTTAEVHVLRAYQF